MKEFTLLKYATQRVLRLALVITVIMIIWHLTLIYSEIPYINHTISWLTTVLAPVLALVGCNVILCLYKKGGKSFNAGNVPVADEFTIGFADDIGTVFLGMIGIIVFIILLPAILFLLPAEVLLGALYYKNNLREEIVHAWQHLTPKESIFIIIKSVLILLAVSCIAWEIIMHLIYWIYKTYQYVIHGSNKVENN